jgi:hypothetical protein
VLDYYLLGKVPEFKEGAPGGYGKPGAGTVQEDEDEEESD